MNNCKYPSTDDIAEMKARGDEASTIVKAEWQCQRGVEARALCQIIEEAFAGVTLDGGVGLLEGQGLDDYADAETCAAYRSTDEKEDWRRIPIEALNRCESSLNFFDAAGMKFHLPAYMIAELEDKHLCGPTHILSQMPAYSVEKFALLSDEQRNAIRSFLMFMSGDDDYQFELPHIMRSLEEYWIE